MPLFRPIDEYKPYPTLFSTTECGRVIKKDPYPLVKRSRAEKCEGSSPCAQKGSRCSFVIHGEHPEAISEKTKLDPARVAHYSTPQGVAELNKKGISLALEKRVALFFQQAILCYNMSDFVFSARGADAQIGSSSSVKFSSTTGHTTVHKREAAHSSTIPTLIARAKDGSTPDGFVYLKGGTSYHQHQATIGMHVDVNGADELIDGNGNDGKFKDTKLRTTTVGILNLVADGLDPAKATKKFCKALQNEIALTLEELSPDDGRALVLQRYQHKASKIRTAINDPTLYDRLIGVIIDANNPHEEILRSVVYKKRYDIIRLQEIIECRIQKRIHNFQSKISKSDKSYIEYVLLKAFADTPQKKIMEKLLSKTTAFFEQDYPSSASLRSFKTRVNNVRKKHQVHINNLMRELRADFRELQCAEQTYRSGIFKSLRDQIHHWTQSDFCTHYHSKTNQSVSQSWVSRIENLSRLPSKATYATPISQRRRFVTISDGERCARTFGVDSGIFFPALFTS